MKAKLKVKMLQMDFESPRREVGFTHEIWNNTTSNRLTITQYTIRQTKSDFFNRNLHFSISSISIASAKEEKNEFHNKIMYAIVNNNSSKKSR